MTRRTGYVSWAARGGVRASPGTAGAAARARAASPACRGVAARRLRSAPTTRDSAMETDLPGRRIWVNPQLHYAAVQRGRRLDGFSREADGALQHRCAIWRAAPQERSASAPGLCSRRLDALVADGRLSSAVYERLLGP